MQHFTRVVEIPFTISKVNKGLTTQKIHYSTKLLLISFVEFLFFFLCFLVWLLLPPHFKCRGLRLHLITWHWHTPYLVCFLWTRIAVTDNSTRTTHNNYSHAPDRIQTHNPSKWEAADISLDCMATGTGLCRIMKSTPATYKAVRSTQLPLIYSAFYDPSKPLRRSLT